MSVNIIQDFIPKGRKNRPGFAMTPLYITIHDTGNTSAGAGAKNHASYLKGDAAVSWHFTVDDKEIYQHLPLSENGWHAGDGNGDGNRKSIGVEICMNSDGNRTKAEANAAWLVAKLTREEKSLKQFPDSIVQHNKWNGKNCPSVLRGRSGGWTGFISAIKNERAAAMGIHIIKPGDTFYDLAQTYNVTVAAIQAANPTAKPSALQIGQEIVIPRAGDQSAEVAALKAANATLQAEITKIKGQLAHSQGEYQRVQTENNDYRTRMKQASALLII